jgi:uncharacterized protein (TIGR02271 family)
MIEHIVAVFPDTDSADAAERDLADAGIAGAAVRRYRGGAATTTEARSAQPSGFWAWLLGEEGTNVTPPRSAEAARFESSAGSGRAVLSVTVEDDSRIHQAISILEAHGPIEMDESTEGVEMNQPPASSSSGSAGTTGPNAAVVQPGTSARNQEEIIPLAKEELEIGKRKVDRGTTRVRRYVVEQPVEREVTLQGERVTIERRRPAGTSPGSGEFQERIVEVHETDEVPTVDKHAHVAEEVAVRREIAERTEKVRDTIRREEVEVTPSENARTDPGRRNPS